MNPNAEKNAARIENRLVNRSQNCTLAANAVCAVGFWARFRGLAGQNVPNDFALGLPQCDWVHTWGMRGPLDIAFCNGQNVVLLVFLDIPPRRILPRVRGAAIAWEIKAGDFGEGRVQTGDLVVLE